MWVSDGGGIFGESVFLLLLLLTWSFFSLLWNRCSASSQVLFRGNCFICSCIFVVSVDIGKFRIFPCYHPELSSKFILYVVITML